MGNTVFRDLLTGFEHPAEDATVVAYEEGLSEWDRLMKFKVV
jgi:hypothetical protein